MRLIPLVALLTLSVAAEAADKVQSLNLKPGLWEVTTTLSSKPDIPIPATLLEKLTPEQRARVEERMNTNPPKTSRITRRKYCLTEQQLNRGPTFGQDRKSCQRTTVTSTEIEADVRLECVDHNTRSGETVHMEALSSESVKGSVRFSATSGEDTANSDATFTAKWVGPVCSPH